MRRNQKPVGIWVGGFNIEFPLPTYREGGFAEPMYATDPNAMPELWASFETRVPDSRAMGRFSRSCMGRFCWSRIRKNTYPVEGNDFTALVPQRRMRPNYPTHVALSS